jgi:hypothetical protein
VTRIFSEFFGKLSFKEIYDEVHSTNKETPSTGCRDPVRTEGTCFKTILTTVPETCLRASTFGSFSRDRRFQGIRRRTIASIEGERCAARWRKAARHRGW